MVKKMNKKEFINELARNLSYPEDKCLIIDEILESNFVISKKNRDKIISQLSIKLDISTQDATHIYDISVKIIKDEVVRNLKHPFRSKD